MGVAEAIGLDPVSVLVQEFVRALYQRAQGLEWRSAPQGLVADIAEGELLLSPLQGPTASWRLTVIFHAAPQATDGEAASQTPIERGRRVITWGALARLQQCALDLAMHGVPGGPTFTGEPTIWHEVAFDGSLRMTVPDGELRISPVGGEMCTLTHEDGAGVELLSLGTEEELRRQAFPMCLTRATRPLQIRVHGRRVNMRSIGVAGVLGYHELKDGGIIVLAIVRDDIVVLHLRGVFHRLLARLSWADLMFGEPIEVRPSAGLAREVARTEFRDARAGELSGLVETPAANLSSGVVAVVDGPPVAGAAITSAAAATDRPATVHTPMADRHRELCRRYFRRLHDRLTGRGARKARALVLLILEMLDDLREDITGSRLEIHARLKCVVPQPLPGGPRNIRDCLDLLIRTSPFARAEPGRRCTLRFAELHDPESELMRFIAGEEERETPAANVSPSAPLTFEPEVDDSRATAASQPRVTAEDTPEPANSSEPLVPQAATAAPSISAVAGPALLPDPDVDPSLVQVFRRLGHQVEPTSLAAPENTAGREKPPPPTALSSNAAPTQRPTAVETVTTPSRQVLHGFVRRRGSYFLGEYVDDDDETDAPSRFNGCTEKGGAPAPPGPAKPKTGDKA